MKRIATIAVLVLMPVLSFAAAAPDPASTSGLWKVEGDIMGTPVNMMCTLTEADHAIAGTCSSAADGYAPHKVAGKVKGNSIEWHLQSAMQGNSITLIVSGKLNEDGSKIDGDLDVEPMGVGGAFAAQRASADATMPAPSSPAATAPAAVPAAAATLAPVPLVDPALAAGIWKVDGDVQGTPVLMTCVLAAADSKLSGTCSGAGEDTTPRKLTGAIGEKGLAWHFDTAYQGNPITVSMQAGLSADGKKMNGTMSVEPMGVDGTFVAAKQ